MSQTGTIDPGTGGGPAELPDSPSSAGSLAAGAATDTDGSGEVTATGEARRSRSGGDGGGDRTGGGDGSGTVEASRLEHEGDVAADYLEELLDIADLDGDIDIDVEGGRPVVSLVGDGLGHLVGPEGAVIGALQDLTRLAVIRQTGDRSRLVVDVDGYRDRRRGEVTELAGDAVRRVRDGGEAVELPPMGAFERKIAHDVVADAGLVSASEGEEPRRHVVVRAS